MPLTASQPAGSASAPWASVARRTQCWRRCQSDISSWTAAWSSGGPPARMHERGRASGRQRRGFPESANCQSRKVGRREKRNRDGRGTDAWRKRREQKTKETYGGSSLRRGLSRGECPGNILPRPLSRAVGGGTTDVAGSAAGGRHELAEALGPKLTSLRFREVGVLDQKDVPVAGDGPREQLVVGHGDSHDVRLFLSLSLSRVWQLVSV